MTIKEIRESAGKTTSEAARALKLPLSEYEQLEASGGSIPFYAIIEFCELVQRFDMPFCENVLGDRDFLYRYGKAFVGPEFTRAQYNMLREQNIYEYIEYCSDHFEKDDNRAFSFLRIARVLAGKDIQKITKDLGIDQQTLFSYEKKGTRPSISMLYKLSKVYEVDPGDLFGWYVMGTDQERGERFRRILNILPGKTSVKEVAERINVDSDMIQRWLHGEAVPIVYAELLAHEYNFPVEFLRSYVSKLEHRYQVRAAHDHIFSHIPSEMMFDYLNRAGSPASKKTCKGVIICGVTCFSFVDFLVFDLARLSGEAEKAQKDEKAYYFIDSDKNIFPLTERTIDVGSFHRVSETEDSIAFSFLSKQSLLLNERKQERYQSRYDDMIRSIAELDDDDHEPELFIQTIGNEEAKRFTLIIYKECIIPMNSLSTRLKI